jgi:hypothetical protein
LQSNPRSRRVRFRFWESNVIDNIVVI